MKTALLLIDIQNDYFPGGRYEVVGASAASLVGGATAGGSSRGRPARGAPRAGPGTPTQH